MTPTISVAIPTRNHPCELARCLQSLVPYRDQLLEIIVVDNGSVGDGTRDAAERFRITYVREPVVGRESARNRAIACARGDVIAFIDDDCQVTTGWVDAMVEAFADPIVGAVTGRAICGSGANWIQKQFDSFRAVSSQQPVESTPAGVGDVYYRAVVGIGANMACRRDLLLQLNGFPIVTNSEDDYILCSIVRAGYTVRYKPVSLVYQQHRSTLHATLHRLGQYGVGAMRVLWYLSAEDRSFVRLVKNVVWMYCQNLRQLAACILRRRFWHVLFSLSHLAGFAVGAFIPWGWRAHFSGTLPPRDGITSAPPI